MLIIPDINLSNTCGVNTTDNNYDTILLNENWGIRPAIVISDTGQPQVVTCCHHAGGTKYYVLYPPCYPDHHLSARYTNQLSPVVIEPRIARTTCAKEFCTTLGMNRQFSHYSGINSCDVDLNCNISVSSELLCGHESIALAGCSDLHALLSCKIAKCQISQELSSSMQDESI
jgi:hypothetical protein